MDKRGISHIEVMLSFLIFIGFVIFALYFFSPFNNARLVDSSLSYIFSEVEKNASLELDFYSVKLNVLQSPNSIEIQINGIDINKNVRVESRSGNVIASQRIGDDVRFNLDASLYQGTSGFANVAFSEDFLPFSGSVNPLIAGNYEILSSDKSSILSEKRIKILNDSYNADYNKIKEKFNLPTRINFGFDLRFDSGESIGVRRDIPEGIDIFSDIKRVQVLREDGGIKFADLIVRVW